MGNGQKPQEIARIPQDQDFEEQAKMGIPAELAALTRGVSFVIQTGQAIVGHIDTENGDTVIDQLVY
jgi:hypothetical protein